MSTSRCCSRKKPTRAAVSAELSARNHAQMWLPAGCAHGYLVLSAQADLLYKATDYYAPEWERAILWNDPTVGVIWPLVEGESPILSAKDAHAPKLAEAEVFPMGWDVHQDQSEEK